MKILVIEDYALVREVLIVACRSILPNAEIAGAGTGAEGVEISRRFQPDIVFLDLVLPDGNGLDFLPEIFAAAEQARVIALTSHADEYTLHRALQSNVHGFVDKNEQPLAVLQEAINTVMAGRRYFSSVAQRIKAAMHTDPMAFNKVLTDREQDLMQLFGEGLSNDEVAERLGLSAGTVKVHRCHIMSKLGVHSTPQLMRYARDKGFVRVRPKR